MGKVDVVYFCKISFHFLFWISFPLAVLDVLEDEER